MTFDVAKFDVAEFDRILACGLSSGLGERGSQVCIEAAICQVLGLPHGDDPGCVSPSVRAYKINLNDSCWSSPSARAAGLHDLGLAQLGSLGVVNDQEFSAKLAEKTTRVLIPALYRELFPGNAELLAVADRCEAEGTSTAASAAAHVHVFGSYVARLAAYAAAAAASAASSAVYAAYAAHAASAARAADDDDDDDAAHAADPDKYLKLSAKLALDVLRELNSPGIALLRRRSQKGGLRKNKNRLKPDSTR